jgi:hypothetical protein
MKNTILLLLVFIFLAGCWAQVTEPVVPEISAPSSTATESPLPTSTFSPTSTPEPTQTPDPGIATQQAALASCRGNGQDSIDKYIDQGYSSTRFWSATVCQDNGIYTKVTKLAKDKIFKIPALDTDGGRPGPEWFWEPYLWSVEGDYLYLTPRDLGFIDRSSSLYSSGYGLLQLDLSNGERNTLLKPYDGGYTFALSEDGRLFAFLSDIPRTITVRDVKTKEERQLSFKEKYKILEMRWTLDGARLLILTEESTEDPAQGGFSIFEYSLEREDLQKLVDKNNLNTLYTSDEFDKPRIYISGLTNELLSLADTLQEGNFEINLQTGEVIQTDDLGTPIANP